MRLRHGDSDSESEASGETSSGLASVNLSASCCCVLSSGFIGNPIDSELAVGGVKRV